MRYMINIKDMLCEGSCDFNLFVYIIYIYIYIYIYI